MADVRESTTAIEGAAAADAAVLGNPILNGARATESATLPTAMSADGDAVTVAADRRGRVYVIPVPPHEATSYISSYVGDITADTDIISTPGSGKSIRVLGYTLQSNSGTIEVQFKNDTVVLSPKWILAAREGVVVMAPAGAYLFDAGANKALKFDFVTGATNCCIHVIYTVVTH